MCPLPFLSPTLSVISPLPPCFSLLHYHLHHSFSLALSRSLFLAQQNIMREVQSGTHTVNSHGVKVAKAHLHDWLILFLLMVMYLGVYLIHPFHRFVGKDMMTDLKFPLKSVTVPFWAVPIYAVVLPIIVFLGFYFRRRDIYDLHQGTLGILFAVMITGIITEAVKNATGRPRPDFFWRCFPDGMDVYDKLGNVVCHGEKSIIRDGYKSFPSGHASWSFAGLGFLSLYLSGKIKAFDRRGHVAKVCIIILPLLVASLVSITLLDDYFHHSRDVFAGGLLGLTVATVCYLQFFPLPCHPDGWGPYAYFRMLEELHASGQPNNSMDALNVQQPLPQQTEGNNNEFVGAHEVHDRHLDEMEAGRR